MKKKNSFLNDIARNFILNEGAGKAPSIKSYIQALSETLSSFTPNTQRDQRRLEIAKENLRNIHRHVRRLEEQNIKLQEQVRVFEEGEK